MASLNDKVVFKLTYNYFLVLPTTRYAHLDLLYFHQSEHFVISLKSDVGYSEELNSQIRRQSEIDSLPESRRYVSLIIDEMKIKEDLVYD